MSDEPAWHAARLIPTSGINGAQEQERRATSAFLAVLTAVPDFASSLLKPLGAPSGRVSAFIEVPFTRGKKTSCPDGLIRVERGGRRWRALVEVKTGRNDLDSEQLETYLDIARDEGFDALITISNQIQTIPGNHPTPVDKRKLRKVALLHWSWSYLLSTAILIKEHRGVSDPEQAWILGELIRYLEHDRSGVLELEDMGPDWVTIRDAITAGSIPKSAVRRAVAETRYQSPLSSNGVRLKPSSGWTWQARGGGQADSCGASRPHRPSSGRELRSAHPGPAMTVLASRNHP